MMPISKENKARYPADWKKISAFVRFDRAGNKCEWCGAVNYEPHPITGSKVILTCAHVHDKMPENCDLDNLAALCQRCHNRHDAADRAANRKLTKRKSDMKHTVFSEILVTFAAEMQADIQDRANSINLESYLESPPPYSRTKRLLREAVKVAVANPSLSIPNVAFYPWGYTELAHRLDAAEKRVNESMIKHALEALVVEPSPEEKLEALCNLSYTPD